MAGMGPPPKPEGQRRHRGKPLAPNVTLIPRAGRTAEPPVWPLTRATARENVEWTRLWRMPQAVMWERHGWTEEVALYVRLLVRCEAKDARGIDLIERRQQADRLGLTPMAMLRLRWVLSDESTEETEDGKVVGIRSRVVAD